MRTSRGQDTRARPCGNEAYCPDGSRWRVEKRLDVGQVLRVSCRALAAQEALTDERHGVRASVPAFRLAQDSMAVLLGRADGDVEVACEAGTTGVAMRRGDGRTRGLLSCGLLAGSLIVGLREVSWIRVDDPSAYKRTGRTMAGVRNRRRPASSERVRVAPRWTSQEPWRGGRVHA